MAENVAGMRAEGMIIAGTAKRVGQGRGRRFGVYGSAAAILVAMLITGVAMHDRRASHPAAPAIPLAVTGQQARFLEENTITLPDAGAAQSAPIVSGSWQRFLEMNTTTLPGAAAASVASPISTQAQQRFWEENTTLAEGPSDPYAQDLTPLPGRPR